MHEKLKECWTPKQIVGFCRRNGRPCVSYETIYQDIREDRLAGGKLWTRTHHKMKHGAARSIPTMRPSRTGGASPRGRLRLTNYSMACKLPCSKRAEEVAKAACSLLMRYKNSLLTITTDNGPKFARHDIITNRLKVPVFFAKPYHSWEKGSIENYNKLLGQFIPKATILDSVSDKELASYQHLINNRPRAKLGFISPKVAFFRHF